MWKMIIFQSLVQFKLDLNLYGSTFILGDNPERLEIFRKLENCFGDYFCGSTGVQTS